MTQFTGAGHWLKINLKKDWFKIMIWLLVAAGIFVAVAVKFESLYGTSAQIQSIQDTLKSPAMIALFGIMPKGTLNTANIFAAEMLVFWAILMIICNFSIAIGSSRQAEENGVTELLLGGYPVGRLAPLVGVTLELLVLNGCFTLITGIGVFAADMPGSNVSGNWLMAIVLGLVGWSFGMVTLVFAQLVADSRTANIYSYLFFGLAYLVRMITDVTHPDYTWLSPIGWIEKTQIYTKNNWLPVGLLLGLGILFFSIAVGLNLTRDLNSGLIQAHSGHGSSRFLKGPVTLLWHLQRTGTLLWIAGLAVLGLTYGAVFDSIGKIVNTSPVIQKVLGASGMHHMQRVQLLSFLNILGLIFALLAIVAGAMVLNHLYNDERKGLLSLVHTRAVSRTRLYFVYVLYSVLFTMILLFVALMTAMVAGNAVLTHPLAFREFWAIFVAVLPIALLFIGFNAACLGVWPQVHSIVWLVLALSFMISYFGKLLNLPTWSMNLSPFYWVRQVPLHAVNIGQACGIAGTASMLILIGWLGYQHRDLQNN